MIIDTTQTKSEHLYQVVQQLEATTNDPNLTFGCSYGKLICYSTVDLFKIVNPETIFSLGYFKNTDEVYYSYAFDRKLCPSPTGHFVGEGDVLNFHFIPPSRIPQVECIKIDLIDCLDINLIGGSSVGAVQRDGKWLYFNSNELDLFLNYKHDYCTRVIPYYVRPQQL